MSVALRLCAMTVVLGLGLLAQKPNKPDFSGTWQLDLLRTRFGAVPPPKSLVIRIEHRDPQIRILAITTTDKGETRETLELTTDGKQLSQLEQGQPCMAAARWDQWTGTRLVVDVNKGSTSRSRRYTLGTKGKSLTTMLTLKDGSGEKKVYEFFLRQ
ncbi:MAG: hypothetical protein HY820_29765 [Acidobacteria bacterium]|nr:hypothetical protein [Acidobacteriota bacterium]